MIRRTDLDMYGDVDVHIKSSAIEMKNSEMKKQRRLQTLDAIAIDPNQAAQVNMRWLVEEKLRSAGEYDDAEIKIGMDTKNYGNKEEVAYAHEGIQEILAARQPDFFYGATTLFMQIVHDFAVNNRNTLGMSKYTALIEYEMAHAPIAQENMMRKAQQEAAMTPVNPDAAAGEAIPPTPAANDTTQTPSPMTAVRQVAAAQP